MSDDENRESLVRSAAGEIVARPTSLVRRGLNLLEAQKPTEDATVTRLRARANAGDAVAQCMLGWRYAEGQGVPQDYALAVQWFRKAAEQGQADAQNNLGVAYSTGQGVSQDLVEAHKWLNLAAASASGADQKRFAEGRDAVVKKMTSPQLSEAQKRAREWTDAFEQRKRRIMK